MFIPVRTTTLPMPDSPYWQGPFPLKENAAVFNLNLHDPEVTEAMNRLMQTSRKQSRVADDRLTAIEVTLKTILEYLMALTPEVQALVDADAALKASVETVVAKLGSVSDQVADLSAKLMAVPASGISADDLAAIKSVTGDIASTVAEAQAAVAPAPVAAAPAADPAPAPAPAEAPADAAPVAPAEAAPAAPAADAAPAPADAQAAPAEAPAAPASDPSTTPGAV